MRFAYRNDWCNKWTRDLPTLVEYGVLKETEYQIVHQDGLASLYMDATDDKINMVVNILSAYSRGYDQGLIDEYEAERML